MAIKCDWGFTDDGDLALSEPQLNSNGEKLYKHMDGSIDTDKAMDGKELRDLMLTFGSDAEKQIIMNRLKTDAPDWFHHPSMGGNLSDLVGEPNTKDTGMRGASYIKAALTYKDLYSSSQIEVRPIPVSASEILFLITVTKLNGDVYQLPLTFNLEHGLLKIYGE